MKEELIENIATAVSSVCAGLVVWQIVLEARRQDARKAAEREKRQAARDAYQRARERSQEAYWAEMCRQIGAVDADWAEA